MCNTEQTTPDLDSIPLPDAHYYPYQVGFKLLEEARQDMTDMIKLNPIRPVDEIYEKVYEQIKNILDVEDEEEFVTLCHLCQKINH